MNIPIFTFFVNPDVCYLNNIFVTYCYIMFYKIFKSSFILYEAVHDRIYFCIFKKFHSNFRSTRHYLYQKHINLV